MEREADEFHFLDAFGIVGEATKIVRREVKLLGVIALTLLLPLSFVIHGHSLFAHPAAESIHHTLHIEIEEFVLLTTVYATLVFAFSLLSRSAVVYTVASIYSGKELNYTIVMRIVPRVWKRLIITFLWFFLIMFLFYVVTVGALLFWLLIYGVVGLKKGTLFVGVLGIVIVALVLHVYIVMVWELASVVSVVEDRQGLDAMKKSKQLMKGKRDTALTLYVLYALVMGVIGGVQSYSVYGKGEQVMSVGIIVAVVVLQCVADLVWLLTHVVLYFVCKSSHHEEIDKLALSKHLEMYNGGYVLLNGGPMQFEMSGP
ncbi:uncharacterized protein LOC131079000 [Cryptomeria japonica]|uniref:uncharacterized protein LOC131079000 n=1 Tax=Cryptomeria japonica TaxID=3369 RepID=UPI0027DA9027|nr:uncharacterized protein LOC131079000 [Cryptomeria japonica]